MTRLLIGIILLGCATTASAACVTLNISSLSTAQRAQLTKAARGIQADVTVTWRNTSNMLVNTQPEATHVEICAGSTTGLTFAALETAIASLVTAQATQDAAAAAAATELAAMDTEVATNNLCTATLAEIDTRVTAERTTIQTSIDAVTNIATAQTALTQMNNRFAAALLKIARCLRGRAR